MGGICYSKEKSLGSPVLIRPADIEKDRRPERGASARRRPGAEPERQDRDDRAAAGKHQLGGAVAEGEPAEADGGDGDHEALPGGEAGRQKAVNEAVAAQT